MYKDYYTQTPLLLIDEGIDDFKVFDDIIKNQGCLSTIDDNIEEQPKVGECGFYHMGQKEIAKQLNISKQMVGIIENKALRKLREGGLGSDIFELRKKLKEFYN